MVTSSAAGEFAREEPLERVETVDTGDLVTERGEEEEEEEG